ncbi:hypothetical protein AAC387_Pa01g1048 [Persea americana]
MYSMIEKGVTENLDLAHKILEALLLRGHVEEALGRIDLLISNSYVPDFDRLLTVLCDKDKTIAALKLWKTLNGYSILCKIMEKGGVTDRSSIGI